MARQLLKNASSCALSLPKRVGDQAATFWIRSSTLLNLPQVEEDKTTKNSLSALKVSARLAPPLDVSPRPTHPDMLLLAKRSPHTP
jgi:hypothetical protein